MESRRIPTYANDTFVEVKNKINAQIVNQSEDYLSWDHVASRPVYIDDTLTIGVRMENLEAAIVEGFEQIA